MYFFPQHIGLFPTTYLNHHCWLVGDHQKAKVPPILKHSRTLGEPHTLEEA